MSDAGVVVMFIGMLLGAPVGVIAAQWLLRWHDERDMWR